MKKKNFTKSQNVTNSIEFNFVKINREVNGQIFFEIGNEFTTDLAEAVAIMMRKQVDDSIWNKQLSIDCETIEPRRALYWLTGGDNEWISLHNYKQPWAKCDLDFQEEFGFMIISIIKKSKTLGDIRDGFIKYLNLPTLYEFALNKNFV